MSIVANLVRSLARFFLTVTSLCAGVLGAHGLYTYLFRSEVVSSENAEELFLVLRIPHVTASRVVEEVTLQSTNSVILPIVLVGVGVVTWITQLSIAKRSLYKRVRFSKPMQASPIAWLMIVAGIVSTGYVISNWNSIDHTVAALVLIANAIAILWNLSAMGR